VDEQEVVKIVGERLQVKLAALEQECSSKVQDIDSEIPKIEQKVASLTQRINTVPKQNPFLEFLYSEFFIFLVVLGGGILIWQGLWIWAVVIGIATIIIRLVLSSNSSSQIILARKKLESEKSESSNEMERLKRERERLLSNLELDKEELRQHADYIISILKARLQCKNLKTNLAYLVLEEFNRIKARLSLGIGYAELSEFFTPAKFAVSQFKMSPDYQVCQILSDHINDAMELYEYSIEAFRCKVYAESDPFGSSQTSSRLKNILKEKYFYQSSEDLVQSFWTLASEEIEEIQQILDTGDYMQFLSTRLNLGTGNTRR